MLPLSIVDRHGAQTLFNGMKSSLPSLIPYQDPLHPSLRLHPLQSRLSGLHSASISMQYRITLELELRENEIIFVNVGNHGEVY